MVDAISGQLLGPCRAKDEVTLQTCVDDLDDDLLVREADDQAVLRCVASYMVNNSNVRIVAGDTYYLFFAWVTSRLRA